MRWVLVCCAVLWLALPARAENPIPYSGTRVIETGQPFKGFVGKLIGAIKANRMGIVAQACANCGAKAIGVTIPGNRVIMIFRPDFAVRMLEASVPAGIEAPVRIYLFENADGTATLTYKKPSDVFRPYGSADLDKMAAELDAIFARIARDAAAAP